VPVGGPSHPNTIHAVSSSSALWKRPRRLARSICRFSKIIREPLRRIVGHFQPIDAAHVRTAKNSRVLFTKALGRGYQSLFVSKTFSPSSSTLSSSSPPLTTSTSTSFSFVTCSAARAAIYFLAGHTRFSVKVCATFGGKPAIKMAQQNLISILRKG